MAVSQAFLDMIHESLAPLGALSARRMFGGASLYCDGILFALVDDDVLYLKADASSKARFESEGLGPFTYEGQTGPVAMSYWRAPERLYDEPDEFLDFAREAISVAVKAKSVKSNSAKSKSAGKSSRAKPPEPTAKARPARKPARNR